MRMRRLVSGQGMVAPLLGALLSACSVEEGSSGADCIRSTECAMGLVCIEGTCSADLSLIEDPGVVPELMSDAGMDVMEPADAAMMMEPVDAAMMMMPPADGG